MPGYVTNGMPLVGPPTVNGTAATAPNGQYTQVTSLALLPLDTETASGQQPQSVAPTAFQVASTLAGCLANTATSTAAAATLNTVSGTITTEALTTAAGSTYSFVLTNSLITTSTTSLQVAMRFKTCTAGTVEVTSITAASGSAAIVFTNRGTAAFNGTTIIVFHL